MGSRGSSSSRGYSSFENLVNKREKMKYSLTFGTGVDVSNRINSKTTSISSYKIGDLGKATSNIKETVAQVQKGSLDKRINQLKELGFRVVSQTKPGNEKTDPVLVYLRR